MLQSLREFVRRFGADLRNKGVWALDTIHNLVLLAAAGVMTAAVGWALQTGMGVDSAAQTPLTVVLPAFVIGFGTVYGLVALWAYTHDSPSNASSA